jgi:hypothetical protein
MENEEVKLFIEEEPVEEEEGIIEFTTCAEYISSAYFSLAAIDDIDTAILNKQDEMRIKRIKRKAIRIIDSCLGDLYDELFEDESEE